MIYQEILNESLKQITEKEEKKVTGALTAGDCTNRREGKAMREEGLGSQKAGKQCEKGTRLKDQKIYE